MPLAEALEALKFYADPMMWLMMLAAVMITLTLGIIPGVGGMLALSLLFPFILIFPQQIGLVFAMVLITVGAQGGAITAILLNVPGTTPNAATLLDGFPMTQKGEAGRAIGAAQVSSGLGGIAGAIIALAMVPLILPMIMAIKISDMVLIIIMGLCFIGALVGRSVIKGLISGGLGLIVALIGFQPLTGILRFTFGLPYLWDGIRLIPIAVGLFAIPEMIGIAVRGGSIARTAAPLKGMSQLWEGARDVFRHWTVFLRSMLITYPIGIIPGIGANVSTFVCYAQAKQTSKHPELFGTGIVEGVIAPETANNGKEGGALLTTLALGIPGSVDWALIIGVVWMMGITPGPQMMTEHLPLSLSLLYGLVFANIIATTTCFFLAPQLAKIAFVPGAILVPLVLVMVFVGSFSSGEFYENIIVTLVFGVLGLAMKRFGYSRPSLLLGYVLGFLFESYFFHALRIYGPLFFTTPISLSIIILTVAVFSYNPMRKKIMARRMAKKT